MFRLVQLLPVEDTDDGTAWVRTVRTPLIPDVGAMVILWGTDLEWVTAPACPVKRRMWLPDGTICVALADLDTSMIEKLGDVVATRRKLGRAGWEQVDA
jgi:hypothetical protein